MEFHFSRRSLAPSRALPSGHDSVLCSDAMDCPVFYAQGNDTTTLPIFHQQIQGKVFHEITGIIAQGLEGERRQGRK